MDRPSCDGQQPAYDDDDRTAWPVDASGVWLPLVPLCAVALLVCKHRLNWRGPQRVKSVNNPM